ncbi:Atp5j2 [Bugula neritina]|uniref:Atp5j2 n=1 Tax=Bugula neritina TaxID=10212 RepID=A0A7J7KQ28_BUGNE|nr:Atp5j2 [Bugula neritina]
MVITDTHWKNVKLAELPAWLNRRSKHPVHIAQAIGRAAWRWNNKWLDVKRPTAAPLVHIIICSSAFYYFLQYKSHSE